MNDLVRPHRPLDYLIGLFAVGLAAAVLFPLARLMEPAPARPAPGASSVEVSPLEDIPDGGSAPVLFRGSPFLVLRYGGRVFAVSALCPRDAAVLAWDPRRAVLECPTHGDRYDVHGNSLSGPTGRPLRALEAVVVGGRILVRGEGE